MNEILRREPTHGVRVRDATSLFHGPDQMDCASWVDVSYDHASILNGKADATFVVDRLARMAVADLGRDYEAIARPDRLVVQLRPDDMMEGTGIPLMEIVFWPFQPGITAVLMCDSEEALAVASRQQLAALGLSESDARLLAEANLRAHMGTVDETSVSGLSLRILTSESGLTTGLLWLPEGCVAGGPDYLAFVADRHVVPRASRDESNAIEDLLYVASVMLQDRTAYTDTVLVCAGGEWSALLPKTNGAD